MSKATRRLWLTPADPLSTLRDLGTIDITTSVAVSAGNDERQTPTVLLELRPAECRIIARLLDKERLWPTEYVVLLQAAEQGCRHTIEMTLDDCSMLAGLLDDDGSWSGTVTALRKALGLAGCWVDFQNGMA